MSKLFEATTITGMTLANRFVRSATYEGMATADGKCTDRLVEMMAKLAEGEVGLIITGHTYVSQEGQAGPWQLGVYDDAALPGLTRMAEAVHKCGGKIALQLAHAGAQAFTKGSGLEAIGPSVLHKKGVALCREMERSDIDRVVSAFGMAAERAKRAGFDAVQIHAAHGYLLSQFLSPHINRRTDEYGGPVANRGRAALEVLDAVRQAVGRNYPVLIKVNSEDFAEGGFSVEDMLEFSARLEEAGIDSIEMSGGLLDNPKRYSSVRFGLVTEENEAYYRNAAARFKQQSKVPLILVGGIRSLETAERLVAEKITDYVALCRPLICEPDLVSRWKRGATEKSPCLSDNRCFTPALSGEGLRCLLWDKAPNTGQITAE